MGISRKDSLSVVAAAFIGAAAIGAPAFYINDRVNKAWMGSCFESNPFDFVCVRNAFNARGYQTLGSIAMTVIGMGAGAAAAWPRHKPASPASQPAI